MLDVQHNRLEQKHRHQDDQYIRNLLISEIDVYSFQFDRIQAVDQAKTNQPMMIANPYHLDQL